MTGVYLEPYTVVGADQGDLCGATKPTVGCEMCILLRDEDNEAMSVPGSS